MFDFLGVFSQILSLLLSVHALNRVAVPIKPFMVSLFGIALVGTLLYVSLGIVSVLFILLAVYGYACYLRKKPLGNAIVTLSVLAILIVANHLVNVSWEQFFGTIHGLVSAFLTFPLAVGLSFLIGKALSQMKRHTLMEKPYLLLIFFFLSVTVGLFYFKIYIFREYGFYDGNPLFTYVFFGMYAGLMILVSLLLLFVSTKLAQTKNERMQNEQLQIYLHELEKQYKEIRAFRHDYTNVMLTLRGFIGVEDTAGLHAYLETEIFPTAQKFEENDNQLARLEKLHVPQVKGLVAAKIVEAQNLGIEVVVDVPTKIIDIGMSKLNCCRVLGILLDNAIEESVRCAQSLIHIGFLESATQQLIIIENTIRENSPPISRMFQEGFSTKEGEQRGQGLAIVKEIVDGSKKSHLETIIKEHTFIQKLILTK